MLRPAQAAARLGLTVRQVGRVALEDGPEGLVSRKRGRPSNQQLAVGAADLALAFVRKRYAWPEKLAELHGLRIGVETLRGLMTAAGLWIHRKQRAARIHQPRSRRACLGELIKIWRTWEDARRSLPCRHTCTKPQPASSVRGELGRGRLGISGHRHATILPGTRGNTHRPGGNAPGRPHPGVGAGASAQTCIRVRVDANAAPDRPTLA